MLVKNPHRHGGCDRAYEKRRQNNSGQKPQDGDGSSDNGLRISVAIPDDTKQEQTQNWISGRFRRPFRTQNFFAVSSLSLWGVLQLSALKPKPK